ncbi:unnamed protein product [Periconia digitata]|uniref:Uncharacterized protein n=1 Tax=Periconia digitata TaxID=1303443 RepID=A0A9W4UVP1_9PLEO|nr:unnamed protein product [Periconia digitata]
MTSQSTISSVEQQGALSMLYMDGRDPTKPRSDERVFTDRQLASIDHRLYEAGGIVEVCRRDLHEYQALLAPMHRKCMSMEYAFHEQKQRAIQISQAYQALGVEHEKARNDLIEMANKHRMLQKDLDSAQTTVIAQQSVAHECEQCLTNKASVESNIGEMETKNEHLKDRIAELENEKKDMQNALVTATDLILQSERKVSEIERGNHTVKPEETESSSIDVAVGGGKRKVNGDEHEEISKQHNPSKKSRHRKNVG